MLPALPILAAVTVIPLLALAAWGLLQVRLQTVVRHRGPVRRVTVPLLLLGLLLPTVAQASPAPLPLRWRSSAAASGEGEISSRRASREGAPFGENRTSGFRLFLQVDPSGYADSPNLYAGFGNDPVNNRDPTGRDTEWVWTGDKILLKTTILVVPGDERIDRGKIVNTFGPAIEKNIEAVWSGHEVEVNGRRVTFDVDVEIVPARNLAEATAFEVANARLGGVKPEIFVLNPDDRSVPSTRGNVTLVPIGSEETNSFAHEYGHKLGLPEDYFLQKNANLDTHPATPEMAAPHVGHIMGAPKDMKKRSSFGERVVAPHEILDVIKNAQLKPNGSGTLSSANEPRVHPDRQKKRSKAKEPAR